MFLIHPFYLYVSLASPVTAIKAEGLEVANLASSRKMAFTKSEAVKSDAIKCEISWSGQKTFAESLTDDILHGVPVAVAVAVAIAYLCWLVSPVQCSRISLMRAHRILVVLVRARQGQIWHRRVERTGGEERRRDGNTRGPHR